MNNDESTSTFHALTGRADELLAAIIETLRQQIRRYNAVCDLIEAGRRIAGPTDADAALIDTARLAVVAALDAGLAAGLTTVELDTISAQEARRSA